jgi:NitT/TauT family transport system permease protein
MANAMRIAALDETAPPSGEVDTPPAAAPVATTPVAGGAMHAPVVPVMPRPPGMTQPAGATTAARWGAALRRGLPGLLLGALSIGLLIGFWHLATTHRWVFYIRFTNVPGPVEVFTEAVHLFGDRGFGSHILLSLRRILLGFAVATVLGVTLGLVIGRYKAMRSLLFPAMEVLRPIPAIAWVPISIMLWPTTETSIVFITFIGAFFPILLNTVHGVQSMDAVLVRAARCLGASEFALMTQVVLRGAMPHIFTGLAVGMGVAWVSLIAAEMISGQYGVGYFTWEAYSLIEYANIVVGMVVIGVLGLACSGAIRLLGRVLMPWQSGHGKEN